MSSLFYELATQIDQTGIETDAPVNKLSVYTLVNHDEQLKVYEQIAIKLGVSSPHHDRVMRLTRFINQQKSGKRVDVVLVDEAHLLWIQDKQSYRGKNQLMDLLERARVVIAVFDKHQILRTNGYWEDQQLQKMEKWQGRTSLICSNRCECRPIHKQLLGWTA